MIPLSDRGVEKPPQTPGKRVDDRRPGITEYLSIYQAVIAMVSLFTGFVFAGLLQVLTAPDHLDTWRTVIIWLLIIALVCLTTALLGFHATAHRVVDYWRVTYPVSRFNRLAGAAFNIGLLAMYLSVAVPMVSRGLLIEPAVTAVSGFGLVTFSRMIRRMHRGADYMVQVDMPQSSNQAMQRAAPGSDE